MADDRTAALEAVAAAAREYRAALSGSRGYMSASEITEAERSLDGALATLLVLPTRLATQESQHGPAGEPMPGWPGECRCGACRPKEGVLR